MKEQEKEFTSNVLNLNEKTITESFLMMLGGWIEIIMKRMFGSGGSATPISVRGTPSQISAFSKVLAREKKYMDAFNKYGLSDPKTYTIKNKLDSAVSKFEKETKIKWPFK